MEWHSPIYIAEKAC